MVACQLDIARDAVGFCYRDPRALVLFQSDIENVVSSFWSHSCTGIDDCCFTVIKLAEKNIMHSSKEMLKLKGKAFSM